MSTPSLPAAPPPTRCAHRWPPGHPCQMRPSNPPLHTTGQRSRQGRYVQCDQPCCALISGVAPELHTAENVAALPGQPHARSQLLSTARRSSPLAARHRTQRQSHSRLASTPLETFEKTAVVCSTSSRSFSLPHQASLYVFILAITASKTMVCSTSSKSFSLPHQASESGTLGRMQGPAALAVGAAVPAAAAVTAAPMQLLHANAFCSRLLLLVQRQGRPDSCVQQSSLPTAGCSHAVAPVDDLVLVARNLKALAVLLHADHCNVGEPLLACVRGREWSRRGCGQLRRRRPAAAAAAADRRRCSLETFGALAGSD